MWKDYQTSVEWKVGGRYEQVSAEKIRIKRTGGRDLTKAIFSCALTNMGLIFPMGILFLFMERLLGPLVGFRAPSLGWPGMWQPALSCWL